MASNLDAARSGDHRRALEQLRDSLAVALDQAEPQVAAQIAGQYRNVLADLAALDKGKATGVQDELKERRRQRRTQQRKAAAQ